MKDYNIEVNIPDLFGESHKAKLIWMKAVEDCYYEASFKYVGGSKDEGYGIFLVKFVDGELSIISNTCSLSDEEVKKRNLLDRLNITGTISHEQMLKERVKECLQKEKTIL